MENANLPEFLKLIERYESITVEEINTVKGSSKLNLEVKEKLTGFGTFKTCTLCKKIEVTWDSRDCGKCTWYKHSEDIGIPCVSGFSENNPIEESHDKISLASTPEQLKQAYLFRAEVMKEHLKSKGL